MPPKKFPTFLLFLIPVLVIAAVISIYVLLQARTMYQQTVAVASPSPTASATASASADPTAGWKTYINTTRQYEFKYPTNWSVAVSKYAKDNSLFGVNANPETGDGGVEVRELNIDPKDFHDMNIVEIVEQKKLTTANGYEGYRTVYRSALSGVDFVFKNSDGLIYNIYLNSKSPSEVDISTFDQILSTFKFTD